MGQVGSVEDGMQDIVGRGVILQDFVRRRRLTFREKEGFYLEPGENECRLPVERSHRDICCCDTAVSFFWGLIPYIAILKADQIAYFSRQIS